MCNLGWGGSDGRPAQKECPECGKMVRGLKAHREDAHRRPRRALWFNSRITIEFGCVEYGLPQWPSRSTWRIPQRFE